MTPEGRRDVAMELVEAALEAADPERAVKRHLQLEGRGAAASRLFVGDRGYDLADEGRILVVGAGKAGTGMAAAVEAALGDRIAAGAVNVLRGTGPDESLSPIEINPARHPIPDGSGVEGTRRILALLEDLAPGDLALVLISGGASALLVQPAEGISLADLQGTTDALLRSGATIEEVNAVRKHLSQVKGGQLAERIARRGARAAILVLSDVVGSPLDAIGSGPCAPDLTTYDEAWHVLARYDLIERVASPVRRRLAQGRQGDVEETPKPGDPLFERVHHLIVADNRTAAQAAVARAEALGVHSLLLTSFLEGEAREVGRALAALAKELARHGEPLPRPACLVLGGETTVTVRGEGRGGRNQEVALGAALGLAGWDDVMVATLATDGADGPTDAAGAIVTGQTAAQARQLGLDVYDALRRNDAYPFLDALDALIRTGPTGTNVCDLAFVLAF
jgi:hydroxypyruvate reductase